MINKSVIVACSAETHEIEVLGDENGMFLPQEVYNALKFICESINDYIFVDNQFIQFILQEIRKIKIELNRRNLEEHAAKMAPYYESDSELRVFSVLDGEDFYEYE